VAKLKVRRQQKKFVYIHNDLGNAAHFHKERIVQRHSAGDKNGLALDCMACLIILAFSVEAQFNFLGLKIVPNWYERDKFSEKQKKIFKALKIKPDMSQRPFVTLVKLKEFRDLVAHGKPIEVETDEVLVATNEELDIFSGLRGSWETFCERDFVEQAYHDVEKVWEELLKKSGLQHCDTLTRGDHSISVIEKISDF